MSIQAPVRPARDIKLLDFATFRRGVLPNGFLVAPPGCTAARPSRPSPVFRVPPAALLDALLAIIEREPRTEIAARSPDGMRLEVQQRSRTFGFVDDISVSVLQAKEGSTVALYSRARVGFTDLGVNRRRVLRWVAALKAQLPEAVR